MNERIARLPCSGRLRFWLCLRSRRLRRTEAAGSRFLLAHIGTALGLPVHLAGARMVDFGGEVRPDDGVARAARLRLGLGRELTGTERDGGGTLGLLLRARRARECQDSRQDG